jgi:hypothetical protein
VASLAPRPLYPQGNNPGTRSVEGRVGHRGRRDAVGKRKTLAAEVNLTTVTWTHSLWLDHFIDCAMPTVDFLN